MHKYNEIEVAGLNYTDLHYTDTQLREKQVKTQDILHNRETNTRHIREIISNKVVTYFIKKNTRSSSTDKLSDFSKDELGAMPSKGCESLQSKEKRKIHVLISVKEKILCLYELTQMPCGTDEHVIINGMIQTS